MIQNYKYQQRSSLLKIKTSKWTNNTDKIKLWDTHTHSLSLTLWDCSLLPALCPSCLGWCNSSCTEAKGLYKLAFATKARLRGQGHNQEPQGSAFRILHLPPQLSIQAVWAELVLAGRQWLDRHLDSSSGQPGPPAYLHTTHRDIDTHTW